LVLMETINHRSVNIPSEWLSLAAHQYSSILHSKV
jgi:hypothetical protein